MIEIIYLEYPVVVWGVLGAAYGSRRLEIYLFNAYSAIREGLLLAVHLVCACAPCVCY